MKIKVTLFYPGGFHLKTKELELTELELMAMLMSNRVYSEDRCFLIADKVFFDPKIGNSEVRIILGDCY